MLRVGAQPLHNKLQLRFEAVDLDVFSPQQKFDAVIGRLVLMYLPDPAAMRRRLRRQLEETRVMDLAHNRRLLTMSIQFCRQWPPPPANFPTAESSFARGLVEAKDDAIRVRIRVWLTALDDQQLSDFGPTPVDIAILRRCRRPTCSHSYASKSGAFDGP
jgi:hypothetical protein